MTSSTEQHADDLLNQLGDVAENFVGNQKALFNEDGVKDAQTKVTTLMNEIAQTAKELTAEKVGDTPGAAYIYARAVADALSEQAEQAPLFRAHHLRKQANIAARDIFKGINKMYDVIGKEKTEAAVETASAKTAHEVRFAPGKAKQMTIA
jgi:hypothetical protein